MDFAVIRIGGNQYKVSAGQVITVPKVEKLPTADVLLVSEGEKIVVGQPVVAKAEVKLELLEQFQGKKLDVIKFKAKSRYRKKIGFRAQQTKLKVVSIKLS